MNRYKRLTEYVPTQWTPGFPVEIEKGAILYDTQTKTVLLQLKLWNCSSQVVSSVHLSIDCFDDAGIDAGKQTFRYLDLEVIPHCFFGDSTAIPLTNPITRNVNVEITKVVLKGGKVVDRDSFTSSPFSGELLPISTMGSKHLEEICRILETELPIYWQFIPTVQSENVWTCTCGKYNLIEDTKCVRCGEDREDLFHLFSPQTLDAHYEQRMEAERKAEEERQERERQQIQAREEEERLKKEQLYAKRQKIKRILKRVSIVGVILLIIIGGLTVTLKDNVSQFIQRTQAASLFKNGEYEAAAQKYLDSGAFTNASDPVQECYYQLGLACLSEQDYEGAVAAFLKNSNSYKDVSDKKQEAFYWWGKAEMEKENYGTAREYLKKAQNYNDSAFLIDQCHYAEGRNYMKEKKYVSARSSFYRISNRKDFPDCDSLIAQCEKWRINGVLCLGIDDDWQPKSTTTIFSRWDEWHLWFEVIGGKPDEKVNLTITCNMPNGEVLVDSMEGFTIGERSDYYAAYESPQYGVTGDGVMVVTITDTGEELGRYPFHVI